MRLRHAWKAVALPPAWFLHTFARLYPDVLFDVRTSEPLIALTTGSAYPLDRRLPEYLASQQFLLVARPGAILVQHDGANGTRTLRILEHVCPS